MTRRATGRSRIGCVGYLDGLTEEIVKGPAINIWEPWAISSVSNNLAAAFAGRGEAYRDVGQMINAIADHTRAINI